jgi:surface polysaccharide O-acyltransferase-like enzyme
MENLKEIEKIANQETKVCGQKEYLLVAVVITILIICCLIIGQFASLRHNMSMDEERLIAERLIGLYTFFAATLAASYALNKMLDRRLATLWELKKTYF